MAKTRLKKLQEFVGAIVVKHTKAKLPASEMALPEVDLVADESPVELPKEIIKQKVSPIIRAVLVPTKTFGAFYAALGNRNTEMTYTIFRTDAEKAAGVHAEPKPLRNNHLWIYLHCNGGVSHTMGLGEGLHVYQFDGRGLRLPRYDAVAENKKIALRLEFDTVIETSWGTPELDLERLDWLKELLREHGRR